MSEQISLCLSETILEAINELVHLELLTDSEFAANVNFSLLRNLASNKLFFTSFISSQQPLLKLTHLITLLKNLSMSLLNIFLQNLYSPFV